MGSNRSIVNSQPRNIRGAMMKRRTPPSSRLPLGLVVAGILLAASLASALERPREERVLPGGGALPHTGVQPGRPNPPSVAPLTVRHPQALRGQPIFRPSERPNRRELPDPPDIPDVPDVPDVPERPQSRTAGYPIELPGPSQQRFANGHVIVRFHSQVPEWQRRQIAGALGAAGYHVATMGNFVKVDVAPDDTATQLMARLNGAPSVRWAALDPRVYHAADTARAGDVSPTAVSFNDPNTNLQWYLDRANIFDALELAPGRGQGVRIAVIDTGVAAGSGTVFPAIRGLDLGGTSFAQGHDFVDDDTFGYDEGSALDEDDPDSLRFGHGTFVASIIAATANNQMLGVGIAANATILPFRVLGHDGSGFSSDVAQAILLATSRGAQVINMSLGSPDPSTLVQEAVQAASAAGVILVAAAGNEAEESDFNGNVGYPARYPQVIAVGATTFANVKADYSNPGSDLDLVAGAGADPFMEVGNGRFDAVLSPSFLYDPVEDTTLFSGFFATGTSFACPQVAAVAALMLGNGFDPAAVHEALSLTAKDILPTGFDIDTGFGQLDALRALQGFGLTF